MDWKLQTEFSSGMQQSIELLKAKLNAFWIYLLLIKSDLSNFKW